jgi:DNA-binding transcriptional LysR family regulator
MGRMMHVNDRIGRRMKLHDLHVLMAVIQAGGMGKAARHLNTSQSAVSRSIGELEHALGVRLLDRSRQGVEPTQYGRALLGCGAAVFDELRQGVKSIEFLADPTAGEIRVAGNEYIIAGLIATAFGRLRRQYPGISIDVAPVGAISEQHRKLRERNVDLVVGRVGQSHEEDIDTEVLFNDRIVVVAGLENPWSRRRKVDLSELADEPWAMPPADTPVGGVVAELFRARGLKFAPRGMARGSVHLACALVASGPFLGILAGSLLRFGTNLPPLKILPVKLSVPPLPVGIMTLKNRTISPVGRLFIDRVRGLARPLAKQRP